MSTRSFPPPVVPGPSSNRTTFSTEVRSLYTLLNELSLNANAKQLCTPGNSEQTIDLGPFDMSSSEQAMLARHFHSVIYEYDYRNEIVFAEMKDTDGLKTEHWVSLRTVLCGKEDGEVATGWLMARMDLVVNIFEIIEAMRDKGAPAPKFRVEGPVMLKSDEDYREEEKDGHAG